VVKKFLELLSGDEVQTIHATSLKVLEKIGVEIENENVIKLFIEAGANLNSEKKESTFQRSLLTKP